ncbi:MAG: murein biosynthesis integral membrane protein MurJ [Candidatus Cloacimonetes bacterium]|nr:murein biosynthesis integral membrane protein MurJ [Candidatus Cloacimonadota bacterium]
MKVKTRVNLVVSVFTTLVSRLIGFIRALVELSVLGLGPAADAYQAAFRLANFFRELFGEGALASVLTPGYEKLKASHGDNAARDFFACCLAGTLGLSLILLAILFWQIDWILGFWLKDFSPQNQSLTKELSYYMLPYLSLIAVGSVLMIWQQLQGRFFLSSAHPILFSVSIMGMGFLDPLDSSAHSLALGVLLGGFLQCLILFLSARFPKPSWAGIKAQKTEALLLLKPLLPVLLALAVARMGKLVEMQFASGLISGGLASLTYASVILHVPLGLISVAFGNVLFPMLSRQHATAGKKEFQDTFSLGFLLLLGTALPVSIIFTFQSQGIAWILFTWIPSLAGIQAASPESVQRIGECLLGYSPSILFLCLSPFLIRSFHASRDTKTPALISILLLILNYLLNSLLAPHFLHTGIALAQSIVSLIQVFALSFTIYKLRIFVFSLPFVFKVLRILCLGFFTYALCELILHPVLYPLIYLILVYRLELAPYAKPDQPSSANSR